MDQRLGDYELLGELGRGGMGVVYRARDRRLDREVALKCIPAAAGVDEEDFLREARAAAHLRHPGIVVVYGAEVLSGVRVVVLELVDGGSLAQRLAKGPGFSPRESARLVADLAAAVHAAHERGVIHRDLKPANVLLEKRDGRPRLTDFGLARDRRASGITQAGDIVGTPAYMAPEQARGENERVGPATDVHGLGAILYECLSGAQPYSGTSHLEVLRNVATGRPGSLDARCRTTGRDPLAPDLVRVCEKALERDPRERYVTAAALRDDLERWLEGKAVVARPAGAFERARRALAAYGRTLAAVVVTALVAIVATYGAVKGSEAAAQTRKRAAAEAILARVGPTSASLRREEAVLELTRDKDASVVPALVSALAGTTKKLREATREKLLTVTAEGLPAALDWLDRSAAHDHLDRAARRALREARRRLSQRAAVGPNEAPPRPSTILVAEQKRRVPEEERLRALVCVEALGRLATEEGAEAIGRFLHATEEEDDLVLAAATLARLRAARAARIVLEAMERGGRSYSTRVRVMRALADGLGGAVPPFEPAVARDWNDRARLRTLLHDLEGAKADQAKAIALDARAPEPHAGRAAAAFEAGRLDEALLEANAALALERDEADTLGLRALVLERKGDTKGALADCDAAIALDPLDPRPLNLRGMITARTDPDAALADCTRAIALDPRYAEALANRSALWQDKGDFRRSAEDATRALELDPASARVLNNRAIAKKNLGDPEGALADASRAIELSPREPELHCTRSAVRLALRDAPGAVADATRALELREDCVPGLMARAQACMATGDGGGAQRDALRATALAPKNASAWGMRGAVAMALRDFPEAVDSFTRQVELTDGNPLARTARAAAKRELGDIRGALDDLEQAIATRPRVPNVWIEYALALCITKQYPRALEAMDTAVELMPDSLDLRRERGMLALAMNDVAKASGDAKRGIELDTRDSLCHLLLARTLAAKGDRAAAIEACRKAGELAKTQGEMLQVTAIRAEIDRLLPPR